MSYTPPANTMEYANKKASDTIPKNTMRYGSSGFFLKGTIFKEDEEKDILLNNCGTVNGVTV